MGLYFRAEFWFARTGVGLCAGREDGLGAVDMSLGRGELITVPNGEKLVGVKGSGERWRLGLVVRIGAAMVRMCWTCCS